MFKIITIESLSFHRNGVAGIGFYTAKAFVGEQGIKGRKLFLITFEGTNHSQDSVKVETCRVTDLDDPTQAYRGDEMGFSLQRFFKEKNTGIYNYMEAMEKTVNRYSVDINYRTIAGNPATKMMVIEATTHQEATKKGQERVMKFKRFWKIDGGSTVLIS